MPVDYTLPAKFGQIRTGMIDPMTLANLREQVSARQQAGQMQAQKYQAEQQEAQRVNTLRQLLPKVVSGTDPETGRAIIDQNIAQGYMNLGGSMADLKAVVDMAEQKRPGYQLASGEGGYYGVSFGPQGQPNVVPVEYQGKQIIPASVGAAALGEQRKIAGEERQALREEQKTAKAQSIKATEALNTMQSGYDVLDAYEQLLEKKGPALLDPELDAAYTALTLEMKNIAGLGALAGPDLGLLQGMITPPTSVKGQAFGREGLKKQIALVRSRMDLALDRVKKMTIGPGEITAPGSRIDGTTIPQRPSGGRALPPMAPMR